MGSANRKRQHELDVFCGFVQAGRLPVEPASIRNEDEPRPDISCTLRGKPCFFELEAVSWEATAEPIVTLRHGLAKSEEASRKKAQLVAQGRVDEAAQIRTWGSFGSPPLGSLIVALGKKIGKTYQTDGRPLYLLLYYEHQGAIEPLDRLLSVEAGHNYVKQFLTDSPFSTVWLYRHMPAHCLVTAPIANRPIPLKDFEGPETNRRVIGVLRLVDGSPHFTVDVSFEHSYHAAVAALSAHFRPRSSRTGIDSSAI